MTLRDAKLGAGFTLGGFITGRNARKEVAGRMVQMTAEEITAEEGRIERTTMCGDGPVWLTICGSGPVAELCGCGAVADLLCDEPVGRGTCDALICSHCAKKVRPDRHLCIIHASPFRRRP